MTETLEQQLEKWRKVLLIFLGAGTTLFLTALIDLPIRMDTLKRDHNMVVDGWLGLWFLLLLACLTPGIMLLAMPRWRKAQLEQRRATGFGFLGVAWLALLGFSMHVNILLPAVGHFIIFALGPLMAAVFLLLRRAQPRKEEMFP
ncbi:hypothetical protein FDZ74_03570 [bacterium]|nr:MAG: hypothetical protein FDZ74_03570 [bacterium]